MDPFEELEQYYPEIIAQMPQRFNSHKFILRLAHQHQGAYIRALALEADSPYPFQTVHSVLAKRLDSKFSHLVNYVGDEKSRDIFGQSSNAALWSKTK